MNLLEQVALTSEQEQLRTSVRRFFAARSAEPQLREAMETERGFDPEVHRRLAEELGAHGLAVPERFGGAGAGWREVAVVAEEAGRCLYSGPYLSSAVLAVAALFRPARDRIHTSVDRRFYRARYDAGRTVEALASRLRREVDLEAVAGHLGAAVQETVQPRSLSLWLRR